MVPGGLRGSPSITDGVVGSAAARCLPSSSRPPLTATHGSAAAQPSGSAAPQLDRSAAPQSSGRAAPQLRGSTAPQVGGSTAPQLGGSAAPQLDRSAAPQLRGSTAPQLDRSAAPQPAGSAAPQLSGCPRAPALLSYGSLACWSAAGRGKSGKVTKGAHVQHSGRGWCGVGALCDNETTQAMMFT